MKSYSQRLFLNCLFGFSLGCFQTSYAALSTGERLKEECIYLTATTASSLVGGIGAGIIGSCLMAGQAESELFGAAIGGFVGLVAGHWLALQLCINHWNNQEWNAAEAFKVSAAASCLQVPTFLATASALVYALIKSEFAKGKIAFLEDIVRLAA